ncbi:MAG: Dabb family protein [Akkermansiaceae bacterium]|nr:Dabb family protein [Verrucomicrobiales bacterium]
MKRLLLTALTLCMIAVFSGCATAPKSAKTGKINHIGLVWLKEPGNAEHRQKIIAAAHSFAREIPEVKFLSVGQSLPKASPYVDASFDICLSMQFDDQAAMERYNKHPVHQKAAQEVFFPLAQKFLFYDFVSE